jgi:hypothetical protein
MTVVGELARYKVDLVGVQKVRWDKAGTIRGFMFSIRVMSTSKSNIKLNCT